MISKKDHFTKHLQFTYIPKFNPPEYKIKHIMIQICYEQNLKNRIQNKFLHSKILSKL